MLKAPSKITNPAMFRDIENAVTLVVQKHYRWHLSPRGARVGAELQEAALLALVKFLLSHNHHNQVRTALQSGVNRNTIRDLLRRHGMPTFVPRED